MTLVEAWSLLYASDPPPVTHHSLAQKPPIPQACAGLQALNDRFPAGHSMVFAGHMLISGHLFFSQ